MVRVLPHAHTCPSTTMVDGKMVSQSWVSEKARNWIRKNPTCGATQVKNKLEDEFHVMVNYNKAWRGTKDALNNLHGSWEGSFQELFSFKAELELRCPGSIVEVDCEKVGQKMLFTRIFVALKPCIDGFLNGCRPYFGMNSTHMTGNYKGQIAAAVGIDGRNGMFPIAYGTFDTESIENWTWFMSQMKRAIGTPTGLAISTDASKGLAAAIAVIFSEAEHRECIRHLSDNFKKKFHGAVFEKHLWPASKTYILEDCEHHLGEIEKASPDAIEFLNAHHNHLWCRSKFNEMSKCDYVTNNIAESFNSWIKDLKELHLVDLVDKIRVRLMVTFDKRRLVGSKLQGFILQSMMKLLNARSREMGNVSMNRGSDTCAEICGLDSKGNYQRLVVDLEKRECSCREWQLTGLPCSHAITFIFRRFREANIEHYVDGYYSVAKFRAAYAGVISPLSDKSRWIKVDPGFKIHPPQLKRPPGRPRKERVPGCLELTKKMHRCKRCGELGRQARKCKKPPVSIDVAASITKKRKRTVKKKT